MIGHPIVRLQTDSGLSANIIDKTSYKKITKKNPEIQLSKSKKRLFAFGSSESLPVIGQFERAIESEKKITKA